MTSPGFALPEALLQPISDKHGNPVAVEKLGGKSGASVYRLRFAHTSLIAKVTTHDTEYRFYQQVAPVLRANGIPLPALEASLAAPPDYWLLLEDIPHPLPRDYWHGDPRLIAVLAKLHSLPIDQLPTSFSGFTPAWTSDTTDQALANFAPEAAYTLHTILHKLNAQIDTLFLPQALISADPNPMNWGLRNDGTPVLFDWERFTLASPAIDLAIIVGGLGSSEQFRTAAETYLILREDYPLSTEVLAQQISIAKVWTVIEYLSFYTSGVLAPDAMLQALTEQFPVWLQSLDFGE